MSALGKPIPKKSQNLKQKTENQCQSAARGQKPLPRNGNLVQTKKLSPERTTNALGKPFRKNPIQKNRRDSKNQSEIAACERKTTSETAIFSSNTVFSLYFKFRAKKFHAAKALAF